MEKNAESYRTERPVLKQRIEAAQSCQQQTSAAITELKAELEAAERTEHGKIRVSGDGDMLR